MIIKSFDDKIVVTNRRDVIKIHLYSKLIEAGIQPYERDIELILELYFFGGYNEDTQISFFDMCLEKRYKKSQQSIRNTLSKYTSLGVLEKPKNKRLYVSSRFIPLIECDLLVLQHKVTHADGLQTNLSGTIPENGKVGADV